MTLDTLFELAMKKPVHSFPTLDNNLLQLNVGCGKQKIPGFYGIDKYVSPNGSVDYLVDIEENELPFPDDSCKAICAFHILEHVTKLDHVLSEFHRVLAPGGLVHVAVPYAGSFMSFQDPTHVRHFNEETFDYFSLKKQKDHTLFNVPFDFDILHCEVRGWSMKNIMLLVILRAVK